jgi:hypothetical protein
MVPRPSDGRGQPFGMMAAPVSFGSCSTEALRVEVSLAAGHAIRSRRRESAAMGPGNVNFRKICATFRQEEARGR